MFVFGQITPALLWVILFMLPIFIGTTSGREHLLEKCLPIVVPSVVATFLIYSGAIVLFRYDIAIFDLSSKLTFWIFVGATIPLLAIFPIGTLLGIFGLTTLRQIRSRQMTSTKARNHSQ